MDNLLMSQLAHNLEQHGCVIRFQDAWTLEVYGVNLSEHYLLTLGQVAEADCEIVFLPPSAGDTFKASLKT